MKIIDYIDCNNDNIISKELTDINHNKNEENKTSLIVTNTQNSEILKKRFYQFLLQEGFSDRTPSGNPSTTYDYLKRIDFVCKNESYTWEMLAQNIDTTLKDYSARGIKAKLGSKSHNAVFSALKQYKLFIEQDKKNEEFFENNAEIIQEIESSEEKETEKQALIKIRIGHSRLKEIVLRTKTECEICGINHSKLLIASHIKSWAKSDDKEKLDSNNILLLCPIHDALFDKGLISFDNNGQVLISSDIDEKNKALANINEDSFINVISDKQKEYLQWHRENIFIK